MTAKTAPKSVPASEFDIASILSKKFRKNIVTGVERKFTFSDEYIDALPFISDKVVDITDSLRMPEYGKARLVLRVGKHTKTFYAKINKISSFSIGRWGDVTKENSKGLFNTQMAREHLLKHIKDNLGVDKNLLDIGSLSLGRYIDEHYEKDRKNNPIKSNQLKKVSPKTIRDIKTAFEPWLNIKLSSFNEEHPIQFKETWLKKNPNITTETMRKNYIALNCLFNICAEMKYIPSNMIDRKTYLFPRNPPKQIITYNYNFNDVITFIFQEDTPGSLAAKIIVSTMILTGARNSEVYKNKRCNFDIESRTVSIPADISKNKYDRKIPIQSEIYWKEVKLYTSLTYYPTLDSYMFPTERKARSPHITPSAFRGTWTAIKRYFELPVNGRLYDSRHTFVKRSLKSGVALEETSKLTGHSIETLYEFYLDKQLDDDTRAKVSAFQSVEPSSKHQPNYQFASDIELPDTVKVLADLFFKAALKKNVKATFKDFIEQMKRFKTNNKLGAIEEMWLSAYEDDSIQ